MPDDSLDAPRPPDTRPGAHPALSLLLIGLGLALGGGSFWWSRTDDPPATPPAPLAGADETARWQQALAGTFATGEGAGDRALILDAAGTAHLQVLGAHGAVLEETSRRYEIRRQGTQLWLAFTPGLAATIDSADALTYCGDRYRRSR